MNEIFSFKSKKHEDYYEILGCHPLSSLDQINTEYKLRALRYHPDKNQGDDEATEKFKLLQIAKDVLTDPKRRKDYDLWRDSGLAISYEKWRAAKHAMKTSMHWAGKATTAMITKTADTPMQLNVSDANASAEVTFHQEEMRRKFRNYEL